MRFLVPDAHREFFEANGVIEVEDLVEAAPLRTAVRGAIMDRCHIAADVEKMPTTQLFLAGRDLWRTSEIVKKSVMSWRLAEIASTLSKTTPLRLAYDQLFLPTKAIDISRGSLAVTQGTPSLSEISAFQGLLVGAVIRLEGESKKDPLSLLPSKPGNVVFFSAAKTCDFNVLMDPDSGCSLLVAYGQSRTLYVPNAKDPHSAALRLMGYSIGDRLEDDSHPVCFR